MVQEAEQMREADTKKKEAVTAKDNAETLCYQVEKQLSELKDKMSTADADDLKKNMEQVRAVLDSEDPDEIKAKTKELQEASWKVTQQAYQSADSSSSDTSGDKQEDGKKEEEKEKK